MSQHDKLKELALAATPGPWYDDSEWSPDDVSIWAGLLLYFMFLRECRNEY